MKFKFALLIFFLLYESLTAQGFLYKKGETGYGGNIHHYSYKHDNWYGANFSYTIISMFSIGASFEYGMTKNPETSSISFGPYLNFYPVKYSKSNPITIAFGGGINYYVHNNDILDSLNLDLIGASFNAYSSILYHIIIDQSWQIIPGVNFGYSYQSLRISDDSYSSMEETESFTAIGLSTDIAFRIFNKSLLYFGPTIEFGLSGKDSNKTIYGFGLGIAFK
jgi:hypothetical protein